VFHERNGIKERLRILANGAEELLFNWVSSLDVIISGFSSFAIKTTVLAGDMKVISTRLIHVNAMLVVVLIKLKVQVAVTAVFVCLFLMGLHF
jgi:hypothetical protein